MEENMEILEPKSIEAFDKKAKKIEKHLAVLDSKQTGETGSLFITTFLDILKLHWGYDLSLRHLVNIK